MRLWHCKLLLYLPDAPFKGQLREIESYDSKRSI